MREILFKAKRIDNGEWVEGYYMFYDNDHIIITVNEKGLLYERVSPDTICQYTGLNDKNGNKIWENDILQFEDVGEDDYNEGFDFVNRARVEFSEARWSLTDFVCNNSSVMEEMYDHLEFMELWQYCEVVGNFFDNDGILGGI